MHRCEKSGQKAKIADHRRSKKNIECHAAYCCHCGCRIWHVLPEVADGQDSEFANEQREDSLSYESPDG